jgi:hypothetical protein
MKSSGKRKAGSREKLDKRLLTESFAIEQAVLRTQLELSTRSVTHRGVKGSVAEGHVIRTLRRYLPARYAVDGAIAIDSEGRTSDQLDAVIYDQQYTPRLLDQHEHRFVPAEAIYAVVEVKSRLDAETLRYAGKKAASVRRLVRTSAAIPHAGGKYPPKALFDICSIVVASTAGWTDGLGEAFMASLKSLKQLERVDAGLVLNVGSFDSYEGSHRVWKSDQGLARFLFRLLHQLQTVGTVPAVEWARYGSSLR